MKKIKLQICFIGMSEEDFSEKIRLYKPYQVEEIELLLEQCTKLKIYCIDELLKYIKNQNINGLLDDYWKKRFNYQNIYISYEDFLLGIQENKSLEQMYEYLKTEELKFVYIVQQGGASIHGEGYRFCIHPNEEIHKNNPHVHVYKNGVSVRYSLTTFKRFEKDKLTKEHKKDEKKVIIPFLRENKEKLLGFWDYYMNGYLPPAIDEENYQYYKES